MKAKSVVFLFVGVLIVIIVSSFFIEGIRNVWVKLWVGPGIMELQGTPPEVIELYVNQTPTDYYPLGATPPGPAINGFPDSNRTYIVNATVFDANGDCDGSFTWYICTNDTLTPGGVCNGDTGDYTYAVTNTSPAVRYPDPDIGPYCNFTSNFNLEYYRFCGVSKMNGTATDETNRQGTLTKYWKYNGLGSLRFPYVGHPEFRPAAVGSELKFGSVVAGQWNLGLGENITKNAGNVYLTLRWNASNFDCTSPGTCDANIIPVEIHAPETPNTTFAVDNTSFRYDGAGYIDENQYVRRVYPGYNMTRCGNYLCTSDEDGNLQANFSLWWHVYISPGILPGTYQNMIEVNATQKTICG